MAFVDLAKLIFLAAIWGGSFIFLRVAVPEVGPLLTATLRTTLAAAALMAFALTTGVTMNWRRNAKPYAVVGLFATVLPFSCFSFAALYLPAAYSALLNSTAPLFGALFSVLWLAERLTARKLAGLALGIAGVAVLVGAGALALNAKILMAAAACLCAAACYALSSIIVKKTGRPERGVSGGIHPIAMAAGSMVWGALIMAPSVPFTLPPALPSMLALICLVALSLLSSGVAQAIFIPLIVRIGPTRAMSVSFLIPLFSMLWGFIFLHEAVGLSMLLGGAIVLAAMGLVLSSSHPKPDDALTAEA
jgi:drug/metabolite transporter (DMT)-like permease